MNCHTLLGLPGRGNNTTRQYGELLEIFRDTHTQLELEMIRSRAFDIVFLPLSDGQMVTALKYTLEGALAMDGDAARREWTRMVALVDLLVAADGDPARSELRNRFGWLWT